MLDTIEEKDSLIEESLNTQEESLLRSHWTARAFKKMEKGSLRGATFVLIMTALGTGVFTLHHVLNGCGIIIGLFLIIFIAVNFTYCSFILIHAKVFYTNCDHFSKLMKKVGGKVMNIGFNFFSALFLFLMGISSILAASKTFYYNFEGVIWSIFTSIPLKNRTVEYFNFYFVWIIGFIVFLIVIKRDLSSLSYISLVSFSFYIILIIITIIQIPLYIKKLKEKDEFEYNYYNCTLQTLLTSFGLLISSFNAIANFFTVSNNMDKPSPKRIKKVFTRSFVLLGILYTIVAIISYLSLGKTSEKTDLFIFRRRIGETDYFMIIGRSLLIFGIILGASLNLHPIKIIFFNNRNRISNLQNFFFSFFIVVIPVFIASIFTNVTNYMAIGGTLSGSFIVFFFPGLIGIKSGFAKGWIQKGYLYFYTFVLPVFGIIGTVYGIINFGK